MHAAETVALASTFVSEDLFAARQNDRAGLLMVPFRPRDDFRHGIVNRGANLRPLAVSKHVDEVNISGDKKIALDNASSSTLPRQLAIASAAPGTLTPH